MTPGQHSDTTAGGLAQPAAATAEGALTMRTLAAAVGKVAFRGAEESSSIKSSSSSSGGKGSGSGGGYNADYSSSECSSDTSLQGKVFHMLVGRSALGTRQDGESSIGESTEHGGGSRLALHAGQQQSLGMSNIPNRKDRKSPTTATTDELLDALQKSFLGHESLPPLVPSATTPVIHQGPMPQLNGVRIQHPMDPRIDLTTVGHIPTGHDPGMPLLGPNGALNTVPAPGGAFPPSVDHYMHMLEAVRPFFSAYGLHPGQTHTIQQQNGGSGSDALSSEGFTSFFTTTNSNTTNSSDCNSDSRGQSSASKPQAMAAEGASDDAPPIEESDASSMVVLARVKRKHLKKQAEPSSSTSSSSEERKEQPQQNGETGPQEPPQGAHETESPPLVAPPMEGQQEESSSSSSSSSEAPTNNDAPHQGGPLHMQQDIIEREGPGIHHYAAMPPRIVSESSDRHSSTTSNVMTTTTSGSGTGSGSGGNSGSGSANGGSSGSGNEGKGSSTDNAKGENSAGDVNSNSDENVTNDNESMVVAMEANMNAEHWKAVADASHAAGGALHRHTAPMPDAPACIQPPTVAVREKKLQDKKRKRMNMRREYEEQVQQQMESSESSQGPSEVFLKPGKPVLLDEVLSFAKTARLVVQGAPPFLVVYANAAYSTLTGIECHTVIGKPISALVSIPETTSSGGGEAISTRDPSLSPPQVACRPEDPSQDNDTQGHAAAEEAGRARAASVMGVDMNLEHLVATSGLGKYHMINVTTKPKIVGRNVTVVHQDTHPLENCKTTGVSSSSPGDQGSHTSSIPSVDGHMVFATCRMGVSPVGSSPNAMGYAVVTDKDQEVHHHHHHGGSTTGKHHSLKRADGGASTNPPSSKRRKHHHQHDDPLSSRAHHRSMLMMKDTNSRLTQQSAISHFVIQLELVDGGSASASREQRSAGSLSSATTSTKAEARLYGLPKAEIKRRRLAMNGDATGGGEVLALQDMAAPLEPPHPPGAPQEAVGDDIDVESEDSEPKEPVAAIG